MKGLKSISNNKCIYRKVGERSEENNFWGLLFGSHLVFGFIKQCAFFSQKNKDLEADCFFERSAR